MPRYRFGFCAFAVCSYAVAEPASLAAALPAAWHGVWEGALSFGKRGGGTIPMTLEIAPLEEPAGGATWRITYGEGEGAHVRDYRLLPGGGPGLFVIDERNGVLIDARLEELPGLSVLHSAFDVGGSLNSASYELEGDALVFEFATSSAEDVRTTRAAAAAAEPQRTALTEVTVRSYRPVSWQRAELRRRR